MHELYKFEKPMFIQKMARADGCYKHGKSVGRLVKNQYGNPLGTYSYVQGLLDFLQQHGAKCNKQEPYLVPIEFRNGTVIAPIAFDDFLATSSTTASMDDFHRLILNKYDIKRLGEPKRFLGWFFHHKKDGTIALNQWLLIDKTLSDANMVHFNRNATPYPKDEANHSSTAEDVQLPETKQTYM